MVNRPYAFRKLPSSDIDMLFQHSLKKNSIAFELFVGTILLAKIIGDWWNTVTLAIIPHLFIFILDDEKCM